MTRAYLSSGHDAEIQAVTAKYTDPTPDGSDASDGLDGSRERARLTVVDTVRDHLAKYILPASDDDLDVLALWAVHTHVAVESYTTPRLILTSPMPGSGKTTVLEHLERLVPNPVQMSSVSSSALIPRLLAAQSSVLLIDEAEKSLSPNKPGIEDVLGVLNSGYKVGGSRPVLVPSKEDGWTAANLPTFAPVAMAGNAPDLPEDTMQRSIVVTMFPAIEGEVEESDWEILEPDVQDLGAHIAAWADTIRADVRRTRPNVPRGCTGRVKERWLPLKRVAVQAGGTWPDRVDQMILHDLDEMARDREEGLSTMPIHVHLLRDIHDLYTQQGEEFMRTTEDILPLLISSHPERWSASSHFGKALTPQRMGRMLVKHFTIRSGKDTADKRGYHRGSFTRAWRAIGLPPLG
ncbi:MAG: DUF3631 domain-containing protein [Brachybacterium tyrofermentans]|uniref:DUF3631 domain-containing protein n=1 Tax=Brachybacterium tyrofermentans TaxID=47848 RepID=UPI003F90D6D8